VLCHCKHNISQRYILHGVTVFDHFEIVYLCVVVALISALASHSQCDDNIQINGVLGALNGNIYVYLYAQCSYLLCSLV
jgi:hypothetical protein